MFSSAGNGAAPVPITLLQYRDISNRPGHERQGRADTSLLGEQLPEVRESGPRFTAEQLEAEVARVRVETEHSVERRLHAEYEGKLSELREQMARLVESFQLQRDDYFTRAEVEVIQLSLSIARKILHREAQVDPMLLAALVRLALEKMQEGSKVVIRVGSGHGEQWRTYLGSEPPFAGIEVVEDVQLDDLDCMVETELGSANFGLNAQLKEVEQGFFDLLALKPGRV